MAHKDYPVFVDMDALKADLRGLLKHEGYEVSIAPARNGFEMEARKAGKARDLSGLSAAVTITAAREAGGTGFDISTGKHIERVGVGLILTAVMGGVGALAPAYGYYSQQKTVDRAWKVINDHVAQRAVPD